MSRQSSSQVKMFSRIRKWQSSGLNQKAFCEKYSITYSNFHYWYKRFRQGDHLPASAAGFVPLQITDGDPGIFACVNFSNGHVLRLYQPVNPDYLKQLVN